MIRENIQELNAKLSSFLSLRVDSVGTGRALTAYDGRVEMEGVFMKKGYQIAVLGGDRRQELLASLLRADGQETYLVRSHKDLPLLRSAALTVFPLPASRENDLVTDGGLTAPEVFLQLPHGSIAAGGKIPESFYGMAALRDVRLFDYTTREDFAITNALATAEGALALALTETEHTLQGAACLVAGNGRIGKLLARKLALLGAKVTVSARSVRDLTWISADGHQAIQTEELAAYAGTFDILFNTIPHLVFDRAVLEEMRPDAWLCDLASKPGGVDFAAAETLGRRVNWALSLPARFAPRAAAASVRDSLYHIMEENQ